MPKDNKYKNNFSKYIDDLKEREEILNIEKSLILKNAYETKDALAIQKAQQYVNQIESKGDFKPKSLILNPQQFTSGGFLEKNYRVSYDVLRNMARIPIIKAVIETRKEQIMSFCEPQRNKYSTGFVIKPKSYDESKDLTKEQQKRIDELTEFMLNCGENKNSFHGDNFNSFIRKFLDDSLILDQGTWENIYGRNGKDLVEFIATDGASYRIADSYNDEKDSGEKKKNGYLPYYVQVYNGNIFEEFYPWELTFAIRNPQTSIFSNGYGKSELEDLIETATSIINADMYNSNYFKVGSNPKGILRVTGNINTSRLEEFRNHWQSQMSGVRNAHKLPIIEAEKMDFINTQSSNKDMEYGMYQEYLIKLVCGSYKIDPSEIGFNMGNSNGQAPMFEGNNEARIKYSRDKGLKPLLKFLQRYLNKHLLSIKDANYVIEFVGLDSETPEQELDRKTKEVQSIKTLNEVRAENGLEPLEWGDNLLNPVALQLQQVQSMGNQESNQFMDQEESENEPKEENPFLKSMINETEKFFNK